MTWQDRFWSKVDRSGDCWTWTAATFGPNGYGVFQLQGKARKAHRLSYELSNGPIPNGAIICHTCDNPPCVNPAHLYAGTPLTNMRDKVARNRHHNLLKTHCPRGHEYAGENLIERDGHRYCRTCVNQYFRDLRRRRREQDSAQHG